MFGHQQRGLGVAGAAAKRSGAVDGIAPVLAQGLELTRCRDGRIVAAAAEAGAFQEQRVGRLDARQYLDRQTGQVRLELLPQRFCVPLQVGDSACRHRGVRIVHRACFVKVHRLGASRVPRHPGVLQRHSYSFFSAAV